MHEMNTDIESLDSSEETPAELWDEQAKKRALDELFSAAKNYSSKEDYLEVMRFLSRFRRS